MLTSFAHFVTFSAALCGAAQASAIGSYKLGRASASIITKCTQPKTVALTFDDGPYLWTKSLTDFLVQNGVNGTFFFNGLNYGCIFDQVNVDRVKYAFDHGQQIASHSWSHPHLPELTGAALEAEFSKLDYAFKQITGVVAKFIRPPYGETNEEVMGVAASKGQTVVTWDFDSEDSMGATAARSKQLYDGLINSGPDSILTLNHETHQSTVEEVIPYVVKKLKAKGYKMVTVAQCLGQEPYQSIGAPGKRDDTWKC